MRSSSAAPPRGPLEGGEQRRGLGLAPVEPLGDAKLVGEVLFTRRKGGDALAPAELFDARLEIGLEAGGAPVAVLRDLGEQLHHDVREHRGTPGEIRCGDTGVLAMWLCTSSSGSVAANGSTPVNSS